MPVKVMKSISVYDTHAYRILVPVGRYRHKLNASKKYFSKKPFGGMWAAFIWPWKWASSVKVKNSRVPKKRGTFLDYLSYKNL